MTKKPKLISSIRAKLVSAVAMLLVAMIMVVSSTYAWFTLSTAPEVTGISTQIGANGALEMALLPTNGDATGITSEVGDSVKDITSRNLTWGNLIELKNGYGLDQITLYPSELNLTEAGKINTASVVQFPKYGADGRPSEMVREAVTGVWDSTEQGFIPGNAFGVRGVGSASGMTPRQLSYRNARSDANTAKSLAQTKAAQSLNANGSALADIAITHGMNNGSEKYTQTDVATLRAIVNDLNAVLEQIETAYIQYIVAYAASAATGTEDTVWQAVTGEVEEDDATLDSIIASLSGTGYTLPTSLTTAIEKYSITKADVAEADEKIKTLENANKDEYTWDEISPAMQPLVDVTAIQVNGFKASEVKDKLGELVSSVTSQGGLKVIMATGGGVYADIADQCGDYNASITISKVEYNGITLNNMTARMETASDVTPPYLTAIGTAVEGAGAPSSDGADDMPITEFYGYIIDMAFRTNAAESSLLLQTEGTDRIYEGNTNDATQGHGSTMTFTSPDTNLKPEKIEALMGNLRVVFFNPEDGTVLAYAKLDMTEAEQVVVEEDGGSSSGIMAPLYLYEVTPETTTTTYTGADGTEYYKKDNTYYTDAACTTAVDTEVVDVNTITEQTVTTPAGEKVLKGKDAKICSLVQNTAAKVSALVYLDGNGLSNGSVSATAEKSLVGTMNLQFASSANLVPMEYADLHTPEGAAEGGDQTP